MTKMAIAKYGWYWDFLNDEECPDPTPEEWTNVMDHTDVDSDEIIRRAAYFKKLRYVSTYY